MTLALFLGSPLVWLRLRDGAVDDRGEGMVATEPGERVVAIVSGADVTVHKAALPDLTDAQARAAARLMVAEVSLASAEALHVAVGAPDEAGNRMVVAIDSDRMARLLNEAAIDGYDPDAVIAAPLLLPAMEEGYAKADLGAETVVRGPDSAFIDDPALTPLVTGGNETMIEDAALEAMIARAVEQPEVDLRQGPFARRRRLALDKGRLRRIAALAATLLGVVLAGQLVHIVRLDAATRAIEAENREVAARALPPGTTVNDPALQLREALAARRGPGGGVLPLSAAVAAAVQATPNVDLSALVFDGGGSLRATVRAATPADMAAFDLKLRGMGLAVAPGNVIIDQGRQVRDVTVSAP